MTIRSESNGTGAAPTSIKAKVDAVDVDKRLVTATGPRGKTVTRKVGPEVKNLDQVKPGDQLVIRYLDCAFRQERRRAGRCHRGDRGAGGAQGQEARGRRGGRRRGHRHGRGHRLCQAHGHAQGAGGQDANDHEKNTNWEGAFRVPMVVRWPGQIPAGVVSNEIVQHHDWLPTFLQERA
jgi:hypothetical protein